MHAWELVFDGPFRLAAIPHSGKGISYLLISGPPKGPKPLLKTPSYERYYNKLKKRRQAGFRPHPI